MTTEQQKPTYNRQILEEASNWFVDFRVGDVDAAARERFDLWLRQSPQHIRAYMEIAKTYVQIPSLDPKREIDCERLIAFARADGNVLPFESRTQAPDSADPAAPADPAVPGRSAATGPPGRRSNRRPRVLLAASLAAACIGILWAWSTMARYTTYSTQIGERRTISLADGSTVELDARSRVRIRLSAAERDVDLVDGHALFDVAKDKSRPFIVRSGHTSVRAVGTQFDVYRKANDTTITVIEGKVAVESTVGDLGNEGAPNGDSGLAAASNARRPDSANPSRAKPALIVQAGERVIVGDRTMSAAETADIASATAWVPHRLVFEGTVLKDVVDEFNRYDTRQLVIEDEALKDLQISGVYYSTNPSSLIHFLRAQPGIEVIESAEKIQIRRR